MNSDPFLTTAELSGLLRLSTATLKRLRAEGVIRGHKFRRQLRWLVSEVIADIDAAESEFEFRKAARRLIHSGKKTDSLKGKLGKYDIEESDG